MCLSDYAIGMMTGTTVRSVSIPTSAYAELCQADPYRIALEIVPVNTNPTIASIGARSPPAATAAFGIALSSGTSFWRWNVRDHGSLPTEQFGAFGSSSGAVVVSITEVVILVPFRKWFDEALNKLTHGGRSEFLKAFNRPNGLFAVPGLIPGDHK